MKDTVITASRKRKELYWLAGCMVVAMLVNVYAIAVYDAPWSELATSAGYVAAMGAVLYVASAIIRYIIYWINRLIK